MPVPADYDGDGRADVGVYRPATGTWCLNGTTAGFSAVVWGDPVALPLPAAVRLRYFP